jgi:lipopolysaccharide export system permease protein
VHVLRLQRYLLGELLASFALLAMIITGIFVVGVMLQFLERFPHASLSALAIATPSLVAVALPITLPMSFLTACLLSYGRFADDNEFLALQMGGINPWHAAAPAVCAGALLSVGMVELGGEVTPRLRAAPRAIARGEIRQQVARMRSSPATSIKFGDMEMSWKSRDDDIFRDVFLTWTTWDAERRADTTKRAHADRARVRLTDSSPLSLVVTLGDVSMEDDADPAQTTATQAGSLEVVIDVEEDGRTATRSKDAMRSSELWYRVARLEPTLLPAGTSVSDDKRLEQHRKYLGEYWRRIAFGLSPLVFALLGVPLGLLVRRGSRAQALVLALFVALPVYYPLLLWGENLAALGRLPPALGLNLANLLLGAVGLCLCGRLISR